MATRAKVYTLAQMEVIQQESFQQGYNKAREHLWDAQAKTAAEKAALANQRDTLQVAQVDAVTKLIEACNANLSKAGYLIGKLNRDNSR